MIDINIIFEKQQVFGFQSALRGMRNPKNSWNKSDSECGLISMDNNFNDEGFTLGEADKKLARTLSKAGSEHRKYLRMINVWVDITAPRYFWQEFDTYGHVVSNSQSTMHKITNRKLTTEDFAENTEKELVKYINNLIDVYNKSDNNIDKELIFKKIKTNLPEGFLQTRTVNMNYETIFNIYKQRHKHRLIEWKEFCNWALKLPYFIDLTDIRIVTLQN